MHVPAYSAPVHIDLCTHIDIIHVPPEYAHGYLAVFC